VRADTHEITNHKAECRGGCSWAKAEIRKSGGGSVYGIGVFHSFSLSGLCRWWKSICTWACGVGGFVLDLVRITIFTILHNGFCESKKSEIFVEYSIYSI
jgi:hypothetical protein